MDNLLEFAKTLEFPHLTGKRGRAAGVLLEPLSGSGERYCIAVVGALARGPAGAKETVNPRIARYMLGGDLAGSLFSFAEVVVREFKHLGRPVRLREWKPPFNGMTLTPWREFQAQDLNALLHQAALTFATLAHGVHIETESEIEDLGTPKAVEETAFRESVRKIVKSRTSLLDSYFDQEISVSGSQRATFHMDYLSPQIAACFTAINPTSPHKHLLSRAQTCLWRVARARDSSQLFRPGKGHLIAWLPEPDQPIFNDKQYELVREIEAELRYEAKKDGIEIISKYRAAQAADHLIEVEQ